MPRTPLAMDGMTLLSVADFEHGITSTTFLIPLVFPQKGDPIQWRSSVRPMSRISLISLFITQNCEAVFKKPTALLCQD